LKSQSNSSNHKSKFIKEQEVEIDRSDTRDGEIEDNVHYDKIDYENDAKKSNEEEKAKIDDKKDIKKLFDSDSKFIFLKKLINLFFMI